MLGAIALSKPGANILQPANQTFLAVDAVVFTKMSFVPEILQ